MANQGEMETFGPRPFSKNFQTKGVLLFGTLFSLGLQISLKICGSVINGATLSTD